jgi:hypothetical protein
MHAAGAWGDWSGHIRRAAATPSHGAEEQTVQTRTFGCLVALWVGVLLPAAGRATPLEATSSLRGEPEGSIFAWSPGSVGVMGSGDGNLVLDVTDLSDIRILATVSALQASALGTTTGTASVFGVSVALSSITLELPSPISLDLALGDPFEVFDVPVDVGGSVVINGQGNTNSTLDLSTVAGLADVTATFAETVPGEALFHVELLVGVQAAADDFSPTLVNLVPSAAFTVVAEFTAPSGVVPEPATIWLLATVAAGAIAARRRLRGPTA